MSVAAVAEIELAPPAAPAVEAKKYDFDVPFQGKIVALSLRDTKFMQGADSLVKPDYFESPIDGMLVSLANRYFDRYKRAPGDLTIVTALLKNDIVKKVIPREQAPLVAARVKELMKSDISDREYVVDEVATFARHQAVSAAILESVDHLDRREFDRISTSLKKALDVGAAADIPIYEFGARISERTETRLDRKAGKLPPSGISTGFPDIDKHLYHKGWGKRELSVLMGGAKAGKCVRRDTLVFTEHGLCEIGDYVPETLGVDEFEKREVAILGRDGVEKTSHVYNSGLSKTIIARTHRGFEIEGTRHHPMLVMNQEGEHVWKRLDELVAGDWMVVQRGAHVFGSCVDLSDAVAAGKARVSASERPDAMTPCVMPGVMTPDLAEWLAMVIAEGYCGERGTLTFTQKDEEILGRFVALTQRLFGLKASVVRQAHKTPFARIQNVALQAYLEALGVTWAVSASKSIPKSVLCAPEECVRAFLSTLIGLEGCVVRSSTNKVSFDLTMASKRMIEQVHMLLLNFGVVAVRREKQSMATNGNRVMRTYYRLQVMGARNIAALAKVGVYERRKQNELTKGELSDATARDWIPGARKYVGGFLRDMQAAGFALKANLDHTHWRMCRAIASESRAGVRELTYSFAETLLGIADAVGFDGDSVRWIRARVTEGYAYDRVTTLTEGEAETVDFTVPGTHSFFANGLVSHNTTALMEFGKNAAANPIKRNNVLYVTLEVSAAIIADRLDAAISNQIMMELDLHIGEVKEKIEEWSRRSGRFDIVEFPTGSMRVSDLRRLLERKKAEGIAYDLVIVDYADLIAPERATDNSIENSKSVYVSLRGLAMIEDVAILTATQTNREGAKKMVATATDVADDFNKIRIADIVISINKSDEERRALQARLFFAAVRNGRSNFTIRIQQDVDRMRFCTEVLGEE